MKAIGIKMVELQPMTAREANDKGHRIGNHSFEEEGYEVTYPDGYKSRTPKIVVELNQFVNTWNPYVEPKEVNDEVGEKVHA